MVRLVALAAAAFCSCVPIAFAQDLPARKPGLWETSMDSGKSDATVMSACIDAAVEAKMRELGEGTKAGMCSQNSSHRDGNTITSDSVCKFGSRQVTSHSVITMTGDSAYTMVIKSHYEPPMQAGAADQTTTQSAKWLGPCPADMKPGDMMVNGMKMQSPGMGTRAK